MTEGAIITTARLPARLGELTAEQLVFRWLVSKRSGHTRSSYARDLGVTLARPGTITAQPQPGLVPPWLEFCAAAGVDPLAAAQHHLGVWARAMEAAGLSPATVARRLSAVSSWYTWLIQQKHLDANPADHLPRPYVDPDTSKTPGLTKDQAVALQDAADNARGPQALRNAALIATMILTGARISEMTGATLADLAEDRGHRIVWVTRKGGAREALVIPPVARNRISNYLFGRGDTGTEIVLPSGVPARSAPLFATATGQPYAASDSWKMIRATAKAAQLGAELTGHLGNHALRHSFATLSLDAGVSLRDLQDAMGHKDPRTTRRYDRARGKLDRSPGYRLAEYLAGNDD